MNPPWRYRTLVRLLSPLFLGYSVWRALKDGGMKYLKERLGLYHKLPAKPDLWIHAASVGEVFTVLPLLKTWLEHNTGATVLFTTNTPTGAAVLQQQDLSQVHHQYLSLDFPGACRRFVKQLDSARGWIVETEIWPWLYAQCHQHGTALTLINGRLSARTRDQATGFMAGSYQRALAQVTVLARSQFDHDNFIKLGARPANVHSVGNLKYTSSSTSDTPLAALLSMPYVLAASTHENEELQLAMAWQALTAAHDANQDDNKKASRHNTPGKLLVIVPRHPERGLRIKQQLKNAGVPIPLRSLKQQPSDNDIVYLADTLGELQAWYAHAKATFVGGSLITRGGHNVLEPARYACPTIVGPHTANFADIIDVMRHDNALAVGQSAEDVVEYLLKGMQSDPLLMAMGNRAKAIADNSQQVLTSYLRLLNN